MRMRRKKHLKERLQMVGDFLIVPERDIVNVKEAIKNKGGDLTDVPFEQYGEVINNIRTREDLTDVLTDQDMAITALEETVVSDTPIDVSIGISNTDYVKSVDILDSVLNGGIMEDETYTPEEIDNMELLLQNIIEGDSENE